EVLQVETVVAGDEIDAGVRLPTVVAEEVAAAGEPGGEFRHRAAVALPEPANAIAVLAVPLAPLDGEVAYLVAALADVPRLSDQLDARQHGILLDNFKERAQPVHFEQLASQGTGQIEAEPVDVHFLHPVAQAVHDELQHSRVPHVEAVAAT